MPEVLSNVNARLILLLLSACTGLFVCWVATAEVTGVPVLDTFEPDDSAVQAPTTDVNPNTIEQHWFHSAVDEDWIAINVAKRGGIRFDVCDGICGDSIPPAVTLNAIVYGADILTDPGAVPLAVFGSCVDPDGFPIAQGAEITDAIVSNNSRTTVFFVRISDCYQISGDAFPYGVSITNFTFDSGATKIVGTVLDQFSNEPVAGIFVLSDTNDASVSKVDTGSFIMAANANTAITLDTLPKNGYLASTVNIAPIAPDGTAVVTIFLATDQVFKSGFE